MEPWDEIVDEYYDKHALKLSDVLEDMGKLTDLLSVSYNYNGASIKEEEVKRILKKNSFSEDMLYLFQEVWKKGQ